jgi:hypothetical protein
MTQLENRRFVEDEEFAEAGRRRRRSRLAPTTQTLQIFKQRIIGQATGWLVKRLSEMIFHNTRMWIVLQKFYFLIL